MIICKTVNVNNEVDVEVDVNLDDFEDDDLISELESRGYIVPIDASSNAFDEVRQLISVIYQKRRTGVEYQKELDILIFDVIGKIA